MFVTGEAGIGKSRLTRELAAAAGPGTTVLAGRAVPVSASIGYRPLTEALLQGLRGQAFPGDPGLAAWRPALRAVLPTLDGGNDGGDGGQHGDYSAAVRGEAVLQLLRRLAGPAGLLLILEDLHWADPDTLAVLEYLSDNLAAEPVLCVVTCRDGDEAGSAGAALAARLAGRRAAARLPLVRLTDDEVASMVSACLPGAGGEVISRVQQRAEGIPFLVEELLAASGVPGSFADSVRSRLAALTADQRLVLHTAALLGRQFDWRLLGAAADLDAWPGHRRAGTRGRCPAAHCLRRRLPVPAHADQGSCRRRATAAAAGSPGGPGSQRGAGRPPRAARRIRRPRRGPGLAGRAAGRGRRTAGDLGPGSATARRARHRGADAGPGRRPARRPRSAGQRRDAADREPDAGRPGRRGDAGRAAAHRQPAGRTRLGRHPAGGAPEAGSRGRWRHPVGGRQAAAWPRRRPARGPPGSCAQRGSRGARRGACAGRRGPRSGPRAGQRRAAIPHGQSRDPLLRPGADRPGPAFDRPGRGPAGLRAGAQHGGGGRAGRAAAAGPARARHHRHVRPCRHRPAGPGPAHRRGTGRGQHRRGHRPAAHRGRVLPVRARHRRAARPVGA